VKILVAGPLAGGYATDLWTCRRVADVVQKTFGVSYQPSKKPICTILVLRHGTARRR
jgi:hypothetical protein